MTQTSDLTWLSLKSGSAFLGTSCGAIPIVTSGKITGFKPAEEDWVGRGCSSHAADDSILGTPASLGKVAFMFELGDEVGARRVGYEGRDRTYLCKWSEELLSSGKVSSSTNLNSPLSSSSSLVTAVKSA